MLPQFYLDYLKTYLPSSEFLTLQILVWLLQVHRKRQNRKTSGLSFLIRLNVRVEEKRYKDF